MRWNEGRQEAFRRLFLVLRRYRAVLFPALDALAWAVLLYLTALLRVELRTPEIRLGSFGVTVLIAVVCQVGLGFGTVLYRMRWKVGSFEEARALAWTVAGTTAILTAYDLGLRHHAIPVSAVVVSGAGVFIVAAGYRAAWRMIWERHVRPVSAHPAIVYGAGIAGEQVVGAMLSDPASPYRPVALLDDDPEKHNTRIRGLRVAGRGSDLGRTVEATGASVVIVAIPSAGPELIREVSRQASEAGIWLRKLPPVSELLTPTVGISDIRPVTSHDQLGRRAEDTRYLLGRRVLVTGAGGSIGSELCRQIIQFDPADLIMLDRDESGLHEVQLSIEGRAMLDSRSLVVCDIRDTAALADVFDEHRPEIVFHAAALKHLPLLEMWPAEAVKTNVLGTQNVIDASKRVGVERFVNISTDKAANPSSVLGYSKRMAERLTASAGDEEEGTYLSVRFGNVLGSRGSVLTTFRRQIENGGPITVTDPEVTRYFMTVQEAVKLVIQAAAIGDNGEALILDMGEPVRIADVAHQMASRAPQPVEIVYTGLRPGEKLHEELFGTGEVDVRPRHPLISQVAVRAIATDVASCVLANGSTAMISASLRQACEESGTPAPIQLQVMAGTSAERREIGPRG